MYCDGMELRLIWSPWRDERLEGTAWYCLLVKSWRESLDGGRVDLYVDREVVDCVRVWKNGIVGGRLRSSYAAPEARLLSKGREIRFSEYVEDMAVETEDLLRLCRVVRLSSSGFMSGGNLVIFRNVTAR